MRASFAAIAILVTSAVFVNCADSDPESRGTDPQDGAAGPEASVDAGAAPDARSSACDAGDSTCTSETLPCAATDFCPVPPPSELYRQYAVNAVWGSSATNVYAVGAAGTIARWDGTSFKLEPPLTTYTLNAIWGAGPDNVWVGSTPAVILHRNANGWEKAPPAESNLYRLHGAVLRTAWGPRDGGMVFFGGDRLTKTDGQDPETQLWSSSTSSVLWTGASQIPFFSVLGVWGSSADDYWVIGHIFQKGGAAYHVVTSGETKMPDWILTDLQTAATLNAVWGSGPNDVWAVGQNGMIRHHTGSVSARWEPVASPTSQDLHAVWGSGPNDVWIAGEGGALLHWDGTKWRRLLASFPVGANPKLYGIWGSGPNDVWAVGESGTILHSSGVRTAEPGGEER